MISESSIRPKPIPLCSDNTLHEGPIALAEQTLLDQTTAATLAQAFQALADPTRVRLISALHSTELCVCDLAALLGMSQSAVSHQLRSLRDQRLVRTRREGRTVYYALDDDHIRALFDLGLTHVCHEEENR